MNVHSRLFPGKEKETKALMTKHSRTHSIIIMRTNTVLIIKFDERGGTNSARSESSIPRNQARPKGRSRKNSRVVPRHRTGALVGFERAKPFTFATERSAAPQGPVKRRRKAKGGARSDRSRPFLPQAKMVARLTPYLKPAKHTELLIFPKPIKPEFPIVSLNCTKKASHSPTSRSKPVRRKARFAQPY